jgi:hypothetical protein
VPSKKGGSATPIVPVLVPGNTSNEALVFMSFGILQIWHILKLLLDWMVWCTAAV